MRKFFYNLYVKATGDIDEITFRRQWRWVYNLTEGITGLAKLASGMSVVGLFAIAAGLDDGTIFAVSILYIFLPLMALMLVIVVFTNVADKLLPEERTH